MPNGTECEVPSMKNGKTRILIAEDDMVSCRLLEATLLRHGYEVVVTRDGAEAWAGMDRPDAPKVAILDWMMPNISGVEVCERVRARTTDQPPYLMLLTARGTRDDIVSGLNAGANDYLTKPFDASELLARVRVGLRVVELQAALASRVRELEVALDNVKKLEGLLPICSYCKKIRNDQNYWQQVESYVGENAGVRFSHGICPDCFEKEIKPQLKDLQFTGDSLWDGGGTEADAGGGTK